jgi:hypothetical protein
MKKTIDFVLSEPDAENYFKEGMVVNRFREIGQFKYSLRSLEKHLSFARRVFIVTNNQIPSFLNTSHPQIRIIFHSQLLPSGNKPLFNSMGTEMIHKFFSKLTLFQPFSQ